MRLISFALTTEQFLARTKGVTRRDGWLFAKPGMEAMGVRKAMGLRKGEKVHRLSPIRFRSVHREPLNAITQEQVVLEGFPDMTPAEFVQMYASHNGGPVDKPVTVLHFDHFDPETGEWTRVSVDSTTMQIVRTRYKQ